MRAKRLYLAISVTAFSIAWPTTGHCGDPAAAAIDVSLVTPKDFLAIVIHPRRIAQTPLVAEALKEETIAAGIKKFGIDPSEVEEIEVLFSQSKRFPVEPAPVMIARFTHDVDAKEVLTKLQEGVRPHEPQPLKEIMVDGKTFFQLGGPEAPRAYAPSRNAIVLTSIENMGKVASGVGSKGPLVDRLKKADANCEITVAFAPEAIPDFDGIIASIQTGAPTLVVNYLDAAKTIRGGTATFNLTGPQLIHVVLDTEDTKAADNVKDLLEQAQRMASAGLVAAKLSMPKDSPAAYGPVLKLADQMLDGGKATKTGTQVTLDFKRPEMLNTAGPQIVTAVQQSILEARANARRAQQLNNMRQISVAMLQFESEYRTIPPAVIEKDGKPLLSWRVAILPYLGEDAIYHQFHLDEPWDSPHNREVAKKMPAVFQSPDSPSEGKTRVMLFTGKGAAFDGGKKVDFADIHDGTSNTIFCIEAGADKAVPWTKPEDLPFDPEKPLATLGKVSPKGFIVAFFDCSVYTLKVDDKTLKALITPDGSEVIDEEKVRGRK